MDLTVSVRYGWALLTETDTGRTALAVPTVTPERITFDIQGWHDSYDDAFLIVAAMNAADLTIEDLIGGRSSETTDHAVDPPQIEAAPAD
jgi:hypothetical protein